MTTLLSRETGKNRFQVGPDETSDSLTGSVSAFERQYVLKGEHSAMTGRTVRGFAIPTPGKTFEQRATRLYK